MKTKKYQIHKQIITFLVIFITLSSTVYLWMFSSSEKNQLAIFVMMYIPGLSAILTTLYYRVGITKKQLRFGKWKIIFISYLLPLLVAFVAYGSSWLLNFTNFSTEQIVYNQWVDMLGFTLPAPLIISILSKIFLLSLLAVIFVFGEELGWSGFLTPKLREICSIKTTSIVVGIIWATWHFPAIIGGFYAEGIPLKFSLPGFIVVLTGVSFIRTLLLEKSNSIWVGVILHISHNVFVMELFLELTAYKGNTYYFLSETGMVVGFVYIITAFVCYYILKKSKGIATNPNSLTLK